MPAPNFYAANLFRITQAAGEEDADNPDKVYFEGTIATGAITTQFHEMQPRALRQFARAAKDIIVLPEHNQKLQPIGRSVSGRYVRAENATYAKFYIQRGLSLTNAGYRDTDSYIKSLQAGTSRDLSIGAIVRKMECSLCGEEMVRRSFFFFNITECDNGHSPGMKVYIDKDNVEHREPGRGRREVRVIGKVLDAELIEFSSVAIGANPNAQVTKTLKQALTEGTLQEAHLLQLSDAWGLDTEAFLTENGLTDSGQLFRANLKAQDGSPAKPPQPRGRIPQMATDREFHELQQRHAQNEDVLAKTQEQVTTLIEERDELQAELESANIQQANVEELTQERDALVKQLNEMKATNDALSETKRKIAQYDVLVQETAGEAAEWYARAKGTSVTAEDKERERERLIESDDLFYVRKYKTLYADEARINNKKWKAESPNAQVIIQETPPPQGFDERRYM